MVAALYLIAINGDLPGQLLRRESVYIIIPLHAHSINIRNDALGQHCSNGLL